MKKKPIKAGGLGMASCLILTALLTAFPFQAFAQNQRNRADLDRLTQKAWSEGSVWIIVHLAVPRIKDLTAASTKFWGPDANASIALDRTTSDSVLKDAIESAAWRVLADLQGTDFQLKTIYHSIPYMVLRVSPYSLALLMDSSMVLGIEEDVLFKAVAPVADEGGEKGGKTPSDKGNPDQPLPDTSIDLIGAKIAWSWGYTGAGWYVAILDSGIRKTHQFFTGKTIVEACFAKGHGSDASSGDCPNGTATMTGPGSAVPYPSTYSNYDHGTRVAGIVAGNYGSLAGVAKDANIIAVQISSKLSAAECGSGPCLASFASDLAAGLDYIYSIRGSYNIAAVNFSVLLNVGFGSDCDFDSSRKALIDNLRSVGIVTALPTGDIWSCCCVMVPACISTCVAIGSSTDSDAASGFSNWNPDVQQLFAPGNLISSSAGASDSSYASSSSTDMAAPHVAGAWALLKQIYPGGSVTSLLSALRTTGVPVTSSCDGYQTPIPRIRVDKAIATFRFNLTIQAGSNGATVPASGIYLYGIGTQVAVSAVPDTFYKFANWTGNVANGHEFDNPLLITMDSDKSVTANFMRIIYPPLQLTGEKVINRSLSQAEYINMITWIPNPDNVNIVGYKIHQIEGNSDVLLAGVNATTYKFQQKKVEKSRTYTYYVVALNNENREGDPAYVTIR